MHFAVLFDPRQQSSDGLSPTEGVARIDALHPTEDRMQFAEQYETEDKQVGQVSFAQVKYPALSQGYPLWASERHSLEVQVTAVTAALGRFHHRRQRAFAWRR